MTDTKDLLGKAAGITRVTENDESGHRIVEAIAGEANWGNYGEQALIGAAGGAWGGVGGAAGGAALNAGISAVSDLWYHTKSDQDKAAWQANDAKTKLLKISDLLARVNPEVSGELRKLAEDYKNYIDATVQMKQNVDISKNSFNPEYQRKLQEQQKQQSNPAAQAAPAQQTAPTAAPTLVPSAVEEQKAGPEYNDPEFAKMIKDVYSNSKPSRFRTVEAQEGPRETLFQPLGDVGRDLAWQMPVGSALYAGGQHAGDWALNQATLGQNRFMSVQQRRMNQLIDQFSKEVIQESQHAGKPLDPTQYVLQVRNKLMKAGLRVETPDALRSLTLQVQNRLNAISGNTIEKALAGVPKQYLQMALGNEGDAAKIISRIQSQAAQEGTELSADDIAAYLAKTGRMQQPSAAGVAGNAGLAAEQAAAKGIAGQGDDLLRNLGNTAVRNVENPGSLVTKGLHGLKGLGLGIGTGMAAEWGIDKLKEMHAGGPVGLARQMSSEVERIIAEVNRLSKNNAGAVGAGKRITDLLHKALAPKQPAGTPAPVSANAGGVAPTANAPVPRFKR